MKTAPRFASTGTSAPTEKKEEEKKKKEEKTL